MIKKIPGNLDLLINLQCIFFDRHASLIEMKVIDRLSVRIELFGKERTISKRFLALLAWYEVGHINNLEEHFDKIKFHCSNELLSISCKSIMTFTEPVWFKDGFRYIPSYPRYAISLNSEVIDTFTNLTVTKREVHGGYECAYIYSPDKGANRYIRIHRLMALAWLSNNDFINKPIVNHMDGDRLNNQLLNLEWCSYEHNARHALDTGLNKTQIKMKTRDMFTGEVTIYKSAAEMSQKLGMSGVSASSYATKLPGYLYKRRYEIKLFDNDSPWYYEKSDTVSYDCGKSIFTIITLNKKTGEQKRFSKAKSFGKEYGLWVKSDKIDNYIALFREKFPDFEVSYKRNSVIGPYYVYEIFDRRVTTYNSIAEAAEHIGRTRTEIQYDLSRGLKFIYSDKWIIVAASKEFVLKEYKEKPKAFSKVLIVNTVTGIETVANSLNHASSLTGVQLRTISKKIKSGIAIRDLIFRPVEQ